MDAARKTDGVTTGEWVSVEDAMKALSNGRSTVLSLALQKRLTSEYVAGRHVILKSSIDAELERRRPVARATGRGR